MTFNEDPARAPQIEPFPISDADKQYQFLSEETAKQIMIGHRITSPLLFGIRDNGGFGSNKDEMIVALDIFNHQVIQPYQRLITDAFKPIIGDIEIALNSPFEIVETAIPTESIVIDTPVDQPTTTDVSTEVKVSDVTYNGAQIASAIDIVSKVKEGILTQEQAIVFLVQFLQLDVEVAKSMFAVGGDAIAKLLNVKNEVFENSMRIKDIIHRLIENIVNGEANNKIKDLELEWHDAYHKAIQFHLKRHPQVVNF